MFPKLYLNALDLCLLLSFFFVFLILIVRGVVFNIVVVCVRYLHLVSLLLLLLLLFSILSDHFISVSYFIALFGSTLKWCVPVNCCHPPPFSLRLNTHTKRNIQVCNKKLLYTLGKLFVKKCHLKTSVQFCAILCASNSCVQMGRKMFCQ